MSSSGHRQLLGSTGTGAEAKARDGTRIRSTAAGSAQTWRGNTDQNVMSLTHGDKTEPTCKARTGLETHAVS